MTEIEQLWELIDTHADTQGSVTFHAASEAQCDTAGCAPFLAQDITAPLPLPAFDHSAMDGYAFADGASGWHQITMQIPAGGSAKASLIPGAAARVMTGAPIPAGTLFVAKQEDCEVEGANVCLRPGCTPAPGDSIRRRGATIAEGDVVLRRGHRLQPGSTALLAALGIETIPLTPALLALHIATGDELVPQGRPLPPGKIYDSNGPMMQALLHGNHVSCRRLRLADDPEELNRVVNGSTEGLLLISGGSGPGDHDHTLTCLKSRGFTIHTSRINSRPGKPLIFATRGAQLAFGLPGNPLSHWVCFHAFVARAIARLYGQQPPELHPVLLAQPIEDPGDGRRTWTPARVHWNNGQLTAAPLSWVHSGDLRPLAEANALLLDGKSVILTS